MNDTPKLGQSVKSSLQHRLMSHVLWPLGMVWLLGTFISAGIANFFVQQAFDRSLLDDAYMVASHVKLKLAPGAGLEVKMTSAELNGLLFDQSEAVAFALFKGDGTFLAGHPGLIASTVAQTAAAPIEFENIFFQGKSMRAVVLQQERPEKFSVIVAQTALSRTQLLEKLLAYSVIPELMLLIMIGAWLRWVIAKDLQPLAELMSVVKSRDGSDFSPLQVRANTIDMENLSNAVNAMLRRIEAGLKAQKEFTGNVAHELRTPLAGIRALAEYGLDSSQPERLRAQLVQIRDSSIRASHLTDQLLALAFADEADIEKKTERVPLDEIITNAILQRGALARELNIDLGATGIEQACFILANKALTEGILNNLLDNAMRYGKSAGGGAQVVTVSLKIHAQGIEMVVQDNGPGIASEDRENILKRGVQGANRDASNQGMGLGLSIVTRYAELMGAQFWLENVQGDTGLEAHVLFRVDQ
ncbi:MAG: sensor histidine kinase [Betaproteobacteria bacterium]|jgi:two-component system sensor histidine kinase TctE